MNQADWNNWLIATRGKWHQVHRDQVRRKAEAIIADLQLQLDACRARLDEMVNAELELKRRLGREADILQRVYAAVTGEYQVAVCDITGPGREARLQQARHTVCWLLSRLTDWKQDQVAAAVSRDRSTANNSIERVDAAVKARLQLGNRAMRLLGDIRAGKEATAMDDHEALIKRVTGAVAREFNVTAQAITSRRRARPVRAAQACWVWLVMQLTGQGCKELGRRTGRAHSTILYQRTRIQTAIDKRLPEGGRAQRLLMLLQAPSPTLQASCQSSSSRETA